MSSVPVKTLGICTVGELFGGVERHVLGMLAGLRTRGIHALLVLFHDGELAAQARAQGDEPVILPNSNWAAVTTSKDLARLFAQRRIGLVHVHGYKATVFCALARRWHRFAMIRTEHGLPEASGAGEFRGLRNRLYHRLQNAATRLTDTTVCYVSSDLERSYRREYSAPRGHVIPNGIAAMEAAKCPRPAEFDEGWFNAIVVGRLDVVKGHRVAIDAMASPRIAASVHLHIVGEGPCERDLRAFADSKGLTAQVHFVGFRRNAYDYIAHCDAVLMPSLHEGLPYTLLEAMALGKAIIASAVGGLAEVLEDRKTALLLPPADAIALADAVDDLYRNPQSRYQLGANARRLQRCSHSLETMVDRYINVYRQVLTASIGPTDV